MKRREFTILFSGTVMFPLAAFAQPRGRIPVIAYLIPGNPEPIFGHFKEGLQKLGYVEGKNIKIEFRSAEGKTERLAGLAAELVRLNVDVFVAALTPAAIAAKQATTQIPIVLDGTADPVGTGLIASLAKPGGNITGMAGTTTEMGAKTLELVLGIMPSAKHVAVLANATDPFTKSFLEQLQRAGHALSLEISPIMIRETSEFEAAFQDMGKQRTDVVVVQPSLQRRIAAKLALAHRLPAISPIGSFPNEGGLMSYSANQAELHRESATYVDKILNGAKPADLPVQQPRKFDLVINLKTAGALGLTIPQSVLLRADRVIE